MVIEAWYKLFEVEMPFIPFYAFTCTYINQLITDKCIHAEMSGHPTFSLFDFDQAYNHWNDLNGDTLQDDPDAGVLKKWESEDGDTSYAFMLPIPKNDVIHRQVYRDYQTKTTFGGSSNCAIEHYRSRKVRRKVSL